GRDATRERIERDGQGPAAAEERLALAALVVELHPIDTVGSPTAMEFGAPASTTRSPWRTAKRPPIVTVTLPTATTPPTCGFGPSDSGHACVSEPARQAGFPPISTVEQPGPGASGVPWLVMSPTRAAGSPIAPPVDQLMF